ncbi:MAG TPA: PP2C family protein-serine/threonine phosphatase [Jiangellaceae bacterium]
MSEASPVTTHGTELSLGADWADATYPVMLVDPSGVITRRNPAAARLFPDAVAGARLADVVPEWLADAQGQLGSPQPSGDGQDGSRTFRGQVGERSFEAHASGRDDGSVMWRLVDVTDRSRAEEALVREQDRFAFVVETSDELLTSLNVDRCMETTARLAAKYLADAASVVVVTASGKLSVATAGRASELTRTTIDADLAAVPGLRQALRGYPPVAPRRMDPSSVPDWLLPRRLTGEVRVALIVPLPGHGMPAGALVLWQHDDGPRVVSADETLLRLFAARAGAALAAARMYAEQVSITAALMRDLLPPQLHRLNGVEFAGGYRASRPSELIGGDFYDVYPGSGQGQETFVVLGDVCGKGLEAAVLTGKIRNTLHALAPMAADHQRILELLNSALVSSHHSLFATLVLGTVARSGDRVQARVTSAGHLPPLIVRTDGEVQEADTHGDLVGVMPTVTATTATVELMPGETCLLYTDGLTEARGGPVGSEEFGEQRLRRALSECAGLGAEATVERIQVLTSDWVGRGNHDDMAVVAITAPRTASAAAGAVQPRAGEGL